MVDDPTMYVAMNHGDNTGRDGGSDPSGPGRSAWEEDLDALIGTAVRERYEHAAP